MFMEVWMQWVPCKVNLTLLGFIYFACDLLRSYFHEPQKNEIYFLLFTFLVYLLKKPYSKPLKCNLVYIPIITLSHTTSRDIKWRQNKPWLPSIWLDIGDVITSLTLFRC